MEDEGERRRVDEEKGTQKEVYGKQGCWQKLLGLIYPKIVELGSSLLGLD